MTFWTFNEKHFRSDQFLTVGSLQTADIVMEEVSPDSGFSWIKSSTKCGLRAGNVDSKVAGNWKCHLGRIALILDHPFSLLHIVSFKEIFIILTQYHTQFLADTSNTAVNENIRFLFEIS